MLNSWPLGFSVLKALHPPVAASLLSSPSTSDVASEGSEDTEDTDFVVAS
jgi:hypothetical protein